jgi:hypothetical protein
MTSDNDYAFKQIRRQLRVIAILLAASDTDLIPLPAEQLHAIAFFADTLAPVWDLRIIDAQLLKRDGSPMSPSLQRDLDLLVGRGVVFASSVRHKLDPAGNWRLDANYELNGAFADPIVRAAKRFDRERSHFAFVREVVYAMSALGLVGITDATATDASYGNELVDVGGLIDIAGEDVRGNQTVRVARRFAELVEADVTLSSAEMVHLYVRELYKRVARVA